MTLLKNNNVEKQAHKFAAYLDAILTVGLLKSIKFPERLKNDFVFLDKKAQKEWLEYTFEELFSIAGTKASAKAGRALNSTEQDLLERKINEFLKQKGFETEK